MWAALGLFPVTPGTADLALASPLFPDVDITLPDGRHLVERAPGAAADRPYVHSLTVAGVTRPAASGSPCAAPADVHRGADEWELPWIPASAVETGGTLTYALSSTPDPSWASSPADRPPSYGAGELPAVGSTSPSGAAQVVVGTPSTVELDAETNRAQPVTVHWQVAPGAGDVTVSPDSGTLILPAAGASAACSTPRHASVPLTVTATTAGTTPLRIELRSGAGTALPPVVVDLDAVP